MSATPSEEKPTTLNRNVLLQAWALLSVYDQTATRLKRRFVNQRYWVILLTFVATVASVAAGVVSGLGLMWLTVALALLSVALPIIGSYLMNDIIKFTGGTTWIKYRYIAETMRMHIYLYRMKAPPYDAEPVRKRDDLLSANLRKVREEIDLNEVIPFDIRQPKETAEIEKAIATANKFTPDDNGLDEIALGQYLKWRVLDQRQWYEGRVQDDFKRLKNSYRQAQGALLGGALISALAGLIDVQALWLVAITNAFSVAMTTSANVSMFGATYSLFQAAALRLSDELIAWLAQEDNPELDEPMARAAAEAAFSARIEDVLLWERKSWYELAIQVQTTSDQTILSSLARLNKGREE
ncbi:MAG: DUF4231 domain-containing protein [Anaerolineae bacterium]|nr:DUF4231 domain-containing protein [Anaerolineae bacterium]NUQ06789.1 DUF4231 domain-containing protein [Anaerolineae bacterium]